MRSGRSFFGMTDPKRDDDRKERLERPTTTKGRMVCSVDERRQSKGVARRRTIQTDFRAPIGKKFVHKAVVSSNNNSEKSGKAMTKYSEPQKKKTLYELWADQVIEMGIRNIRREFVTAVRTYNPPGTTNAWEADKNYDKNRFEDIKLLDKTRVVLKNTPSSK
uniref:Uncharacterized protein n=1 Tax=Loa loa TaxID=7209 RepID=A0A1I7VX13_LOALO